MLTPDQIKKIIAENDSLRVQLQEANEMLNLREEEIQILTQNAFDITELRSQLDGQQQGISTLQSHLTEKEQQALGAANREHELENELIDASKLLQDYCKLKQNYAYILTQVNDLEDRLVEMNKRNAELEKLL
jgi:DNA repair exonuclease SbcCD ATPase subunit